MANIGEEFGAIPVKDEDIGAEFGAVRVTEPTPAPKARPVEAAQASISKAFGAPEAEEPGVLSNLASATGDFLARQAAGGLAGFTAGLPFGVGPSVVGALTPGETTEDVKQSMAEARARAPIAYGVGEFGTELATTFLPGAGLGSKLVTKAAPYTRGLSPALKRAAEAVIKGVGLGTVTGGEEAGRAVVEGAPVSEALKTGAETGVANLLMPLGFEAAPILTSRAPTLIRGAAQTVAPTALAVKSAPGEGADAADWTKWALTQGMMYGGDPLLKTALGPISAYERAAASSRESLQPKLRRATAEGMDLARGDVYGAEARREVAMGQIQKAEQARQVQQEVMRRLEGQRRSNIEQQILEEQRRGEFKTRETEEVVRNRQFRAAVRGEQRAQGVAERMMQGDVSQFDKLEADAKDLDSLVKSMEDGSAPELRGLLGKLFQDVSNRLLRAKQALQNRPELANQTLVEKINTVDRLIEESYLKNTEKGGYLEDFNDDPYARLEQERVKRLAKAEQQRDRKALQQAELLNRINTRDYFKEAQAQQRPPALPEERVREIAEEAGLEYKGPDEQYGTQVRHPMKLSPASAVAPVGRDVALARKLEQKTRGQVLDEVLSERRLSAAPDIANVTGETPLQAAVRRLRALPEGDRRKAGLEAEVQGEFERQVAAGGRVLQGRAPEADYGEKAPFFDPMNPMRSTAVVAPKLPDWVKPVVAGRLATGLLRASAKAPQSKLSEVQEATSPVRPTQATLERPYNAVAMLRAWDKVLEAPSDATRSAIARISDRLGITPDKLVRTTAYRAAALEQALKDPEIAKEVMANVEQR